MGVVALCLRVANALLWPCAAQAGFSVGGPRLVSGSGRLPAAAVNGAGAGVVAFFVPVGPKGAEGLQQQTGPIAAVLVAPEGNVSPVVQLGMTPPIGQKQLAATIGGDGDAVVAWRVDSSLFAAVISASGVAAGPQLLTTSYWTWAGPPRIATDTRGDTALAWVDGSRPHPMVAFRAAGSTTFGAPVVAANDVGGAGLSIDVALDPTSGRATLVFASASSASPQLSAAKVVQAPFGGPFGPASEVLKSAGIWQVDARTNATGELLVSAGRTDASATGPVPLVAGVGTVSAVVAPAGLPVPMLRDIQPVDYFYTPAIGPQGQALIAFRDQRFGSGTDALAATLLGSSGAITPNEPLTASWTGSIATIVNPAPAFDAASDELIAFDHNLGEGPGGAIGSLNLIAHDADTQGWCASQPLAVAIPPYAPPALALNASGRGLLAWQAGTSGIAIATLGPGRGCPQTALLKAPVALALVGQVSKTLRSTQLGIACNTACHGELRLTDKRHRILGTARIAMRPRTETVIRIALTRKGRQDLQHASQLVATATIERNHHATTVHDPIVLLR